MNLFKINLLIILSLAGIAKAGSENVGVPLCSIAAAECKNKDNSIHVCVLENSAYVNLKDDSEDSAYFPMKRIPSKPGVMGAGMLFQGPKITLHIQTDTAPTPSGIYSTLSIPSLQIEEEEMRCILH